MRLIDYFIPFLAFLRYFQSQPSGDLMSVRQQLDELLASARANALEADESDADVQDALFAVVALADEILLAAPWTGAGEWPRHLLQKRLFSVSNAGDAFFSRLEQLDPLRIQTREVYLYCLSMGFAGRYGYDRNAKALADIRQNSLALVSSAARAQRERSGLSAEMEKFMFPEGYSQASGTPAKASPGRAGKWGWRFSSLTVNALLVPLVVLCVLYGTFHIIIWQAVNTLLAQIK